MRRLERAIGRVTRKVALRFAEGNTEPVTVRPEDLARCSVRSRSRRMKCARVSVREWSPVLAWTETGGDVLYIEATLLPDGKGLTLTGQLGDVMKESAKAAQSWVWSHAEELGIDPELFKNIGRPHPRSGRCDPEGRTFGRHHDGDRACFGLLEECRLAMTLP